MNKSLLSVCVCFALLVQAGAPTDSRGDEGTDRCAIARWFFNGNGWDEMGYHPVTLHGGATFVPTCGSQGLFTNALADSATYPPFGPMPSGTISFQFELETAFHADAGYNNGIHFISSHGVIPHQVGDVNVRLDPTDGKLWLVQPDPIEGPHWMLKSRKSYWESGVCYLVEIEWGPTGRTMKITTPGYFEWNADQVVRAFVFYLDADFTKILWRDFDSPPNGVKLNWMEVACPCPPVATEATSWGHVKSLYR